MFKKETIPFSNTGVLNSLVTDYLNRSEKLSNFYGHFPDEQGFKEVLKSNPYSDFDRSILVKQLLLQAATVENTGELSLANIQKLSQKNTFTVTTGHQLCLFTGPLYFIYKLISTINLAQKLKHTFPQHDFVPVYWLASEDHDFEEVNHFYSAEKKIEWKSSQTGAVGAFDTSELKTLTDQIRTLFGISERASELISLFEKSYLKHNDLSAATRYLVNELFGESGLVIIDANGVEFKKQFKKQFEADLFEHSAFHEVNKSIKSLSELGYQSQVNPRSINCFYIDKGLRARIEKEAEFYRVSGTDIRFTESELRALLEQYPEKISPNVVLRPLYQQVILPNLAYVGGPGELAYWLEFYAFFKTSDVIFPVLMPRNFVLFIDKLSAKKLSKLHFKTADVFAKEQSLISKFQSDTNALFQVEQEAESIRKIYEILKTRVTAIDASLLGSAAAEEQRMANGLARLSAKANRALRRRSETELRQIKELKNTLFPHGIPQERHLNFSELYLSQGRSFFELLLKETDPFIQEQYVFTEE